MGHFSNRRLEDGKSHFNSPTEAEQGCTDRWAPLNDHFKRESGSDYSKGRFNGDNVYIVNVQASDGEGGVATQTISVSATPLNDQFTGIRDDVSAHLQ